MSRSCLHLCESDLLLLGLWGEVNSKRCDELFRTRGVGYSVLVLRRSMTTLDGRSQSQSCFQLLFVPEKILTSRADNCNTLAPFPGDRLHVFQLV